MVAVNLGLVLLLLAGLEAGFQLLLTRPGLAAAGGVRLHELTRGIYMAQRRVVQLEPECARWDPVLTYTLRPGACRFANVEFDTEIAVNREGLRDDETSLERPAIILLGDSSTMGWGVEGHETYAEALEAATGTTVLNAGVPSYGTARELALLARLDTSATTDLLVQYCANDAPENLAWVENGGRLPITTEADYLAKARAYNESRGYRPGDHLVYLAKNVRRRLQARFGEPRPAPAPPAPNGTAGREDVGHFLAIAAQMCALAPQARLTVFAVTQLDNSDADFLAELQLQAGLERWPACVRDMRVLDVATTLGAEHYFRLDDHLNAAGHAAVAERLAAALSPGAAAQPNSR